MKAHQARHRHKEDLQEEAEMENETTTAGQREIMADYLQVIQLHKFGMWTE